MDYLMKTYVQHCTTELSEYGFKRKRATFVRVVNDVMQNFTLEKLRSGRKCRVLFSIIPLCLRIEKEYISGGVYSHELKKFEAAQELQSFDGWEYDPKSEASIHACITEIMRYLKDYLMPFFERANSCDTALRELINMEKHFNDNRKAMLKLYGVEDKLDTIAESNLSSVKYYMALKNGDYAFALQSRRALEQQNVNAYNSISGCVSLAKEDLLRRKNILDKLRKEIIALEIGDENYFHHLLQENEAYSREKLKDVL